jgi:Flp pilus assembly protein TadD
MAYRRPHRDVTLPSEDARALLGRARRHARRGEHRRAMLTAKQACCAQSDAARLWTIYGVYCARAGRRDDAMRAFKQALWLRERAHDTGRAGAMRMLLERLALGEAPLAAA